MDEYNLWSYIVQRLNQTCSDLDRIWIKRKRFFDTRMILQGLLGLVSGHQKSYLHVLDQLSFETENLPAASSFCEARAKFPSFLAREIREGVFDSWSEHAKPELWHGYQAHAVDGTKVSLPRPLLKQGFKKAGMGHYAQGLVSVLLRLGDRMICDIRLSAKSDERFEAHEHLAYLNKNDLVIYDRGYWSFSLLTAHVNQEVPALFRVAKGTNFLPIENFWKSQKNDSIVIIDPESGTYRHATKTYPDYQYSSLKVRLIKYRIDGKEYVLGTTLLDQKIPLQDIVDLYARRWTAEETFKALKQTLEFETFHSHSLNGIEQEVEVTALFWNLARILGSIVEPKIEKSSNKKSLRYQINYQQCLIKLSNSLFKLLRTTGHNLHNLLMQISKFLQKSSQPIRLGRKFIRRSLKPPKHWRRPKPHRKKKTGRPRGRPRKVTR